MGSLVLVPFGPSTLQGVVIALSDRPPGGPNHPAARRLKEILSLLGDQTATGLDRSLLELTRQISEHYLAPWGQCLRLILPTPSSPKPSLRYLLTEAGKNVGEGHRLSPTARTVLAKLAESPKGMAPTSLQKAVRGSARTLASLKQRGLIGEVQREPRKKPARAQNDQPKASRKTAGLQAALPEPLPLTPVQLAWQTAWYDTLRSMLDAASHGAILLQAPTALRLTCLLQAIDDTLARHRAVLIIAPEIVRASMIAARAANRWGERVTTLHSALPPAARDEAWSRIRAGT
ncbi:MAG: hypothetical protein FJ246_11505, partial [Nitrospira sp.]|nr:hypothetical protein [Nitrospira sp.]